MASFLLTRISSHTLLQESFVDLQLSIFRLRIRSATPSERHRMRFRVYVTGICVSTLLATSFCGCGSGVKNRPKLAKVRGVVTYKGEPVTDAAVSFMMDGAPRAAAGRTDDEGRFQLTTFDTNDGAPIGTHKVTVAKVAAAPSVPMSVKDLAEKGAPKAPKGAIPLKYADPQKTPLQYTIEEGSNEKEIELED